MVRKPLAEIRKDTICCTGLSEVVLLPSEGATGFQPVATLSHFAASRNHFNQGPAANVRILATVMCHVHSPRAALHRTKTSVSSNPQIRPGEDAVNDADHHTQGATQGGFTSRAIPTIEPNIQQLAAIIPNRHNKQFVVHVIPYFEIFATTIVSANRVRNLIVLRHQPFAIPTTVTIVPFILATISRN